MIGSHEFEAAHKSGRTQAERQKALFDQLKDPYYFQLLSVPELRVRYGITPME